jgi:hypothetical protein
MSNLVFGTVTCFVLSFGLIASFMSSYMSDITYETNLRFIPKGNPNCLRFLPQVSGVNNLDDPVSDSITLNRLYFLVYTHAIHKAKS